MSTAYRRRPRSPFRVIDGNVLIGGVGEQTVGVGGAALFVWLVLDAPRSVDQITSEICQTWPEIESLDEAMIDEAVEILVERGLIQPVESDQGESA
ncbi:MAG: PqqD family peptide modification chaperone [Microthrixaceae bacterium]|nr:PqqD family peptide modification chaperone [Microthrixaceae bacterium]